MPVEVISLVFYTVWVKSKTVKHCW